MSSLDLQMRHIRVLGKDANLPEGYEKLVIDLGEDGPCEQVFELCCYPPAIMVLLEYKSCSEGTTVPNGQILLPEEAYEWALKRNLPDTEGIDRLSRLARRSGPFLPPTAAEVRQRLRIMRFRARHVAKGLQQPLEDQRFDLRGLINDLSILRACLQPNAELWAKSGFQDAGDSVNRLDPLIRDFLAVIAPTKPDPKSKACEGSNGQLGHLGNAAVTKHVEEDATELASDSESLRTKCKEFSSALGVAIADLNRASHKTAAANPIGKRYQPVVFRLLDCEVLNVTQVIELARHLFDIELEAHGLQQFRHEFADLLRSKHPDWCPREGKLDRHERASWLAYELWQADIPGPICYQLVNKLYPDIYDEGKLLDSSGNRKPDWKLALRLTNHCERFGCTVPTSRRGGAPPKDEKSRSRKNFIESLVVARVTEI